MNNPYCKLDLTVFDSAQIEIIILGLDSTEDWYGDVSSIPNVASIKGAMLYLSLGLGSNPKFGDISNYPHLDKLTVETAEVLSLGLGTDPRYGDISHINDIWRFRWRNAATLSLGLGTDPVYKDISHIPELWLLSRDECEALSKAR
jgi:hypothetical protein